MRWFDAGDSMGDNEKLVSWAGISPSVHVRLQDLLV